MRTEEDAMTGAMSSLEIAGAPVAHASDFLVDQLLDEARIHGGAALLTRSGMTLRLMKELAECMLAAELKHHLLHHHGAQEAASGNYRNGSTPKMVSTRSGTMELDVPRVRYSTFVPHLVPRYQRHLPGFDDNIIVLYGRGVGMQELQSRLRELYGPHAWAELCGTLTDEVSRHIRDRQARRLEQSCELIYFDALRTKRQPEGQALPSPLFFALAMRADGRRDVLGFWIESATGAAFWRDVMRELRDRGLLEPGTIAGAMHGLQEAAALVYPAACFRALR